MVVQGSEASVPDGQGEAARRLRLGLGNPRLSQPPNALSHAYHQDHLNSRSRIRFQL